MKIVCDACQAKYSISDDKVQGKVFKIRCKKCSNIIVVRGGAGAAEPAAAPAAVEKETRVYDYGYEGGDQAPAGDDAVWHVVINQDQVGPMTAAEVQQKFAAGEIDGETYIWREGFSDWLPMAQVDTFSAFVASGNTTAAASTSGGGASAVAAMFGGGDEGGTVRSDPGDLFAAAGGSRSSDDEGDLFGSKPGTGAGAAASASSSASSKLRGERNENSVLFSLGNLAQLASDRPAPAAASSSAASSSAGHATGAAGGEGSGLIDIRSMATAYRGPGGAAKPATASAGVGSIDDLPVFTSAGFAEPAVIMPTARPQRDNKMMYILIGAVGLLAVAAVILVVVLVKGGGDKKDTSANQVAMSDDKDEKDKDEKDKDEKAPATDPATDTKGSADPATPPADPPADTATKPADPPPVDKTEKPKDPKPSSRNDRPKPSTGSRDPKPAVVEKPAAKPPSDGGCDEVSCVLSNYEGACCAKFRKGGSKPSGASKPSGGGDLPDALDRSMISEGVGKVKARVTACGDKSSAKGDVKVSVKVKPDGSVASVSVKSTPDAALGACVASAMQRATFRKTQNGGSFAYPWKF